MSIVGNKWEPRNPIPTLFRAKLKKYVKLVAVVGTMSRKEILSDLTKGSNQNCVCNRVTHQTLVIRFDQRNKVSPKCKKCCNIVAQFLNFGTTFNP